MAIVRMTMEEIKKIMTPERIKQETEEAKRHPITFDPECPPMTEERLKNFHRVHPRHKAS